MGISEDVVGVVVTIGVIEVIGTGKVGAVVTFVNTGTLAGDFTGAAGDMIGNGMFGAIVTFAATGTFAGEATGAAIGLFGAGVDIFIGIGAFVGRRD